MNTIKYKIFNPKTKRYINSNNNSNNNDNDNIENPLPKKFHNIVDKGLVSINKMDPLLFELQDLLGEFADLYSVANHTKLLCAFDFSIYGKKKYKNNIDLINKIIDYSNSKDIHYLHNTKTGGMYLKTVFFHKNNYNLALKLMKILWSFEPNININIDYQIALGILFGYSNNNIIYFIKTRYNSIIDSKYIQYIQTIIDNIDINNIDFKNNNIIYVNKIELI